MNTFTQYFEQVDRRAPGLSGLRKAARQKYDAQTFPTVRTEDWRFTNVTPLLDVPYTLPEAVEVDAAHMPAPAAQNALRLVFVNGWYMPKLSRVEALPLGTLVGPLSELGMQAVGRHLAQIAGLQDHVFTALNTSLLTEAACLVVPAGVVLEAPVEILYLTCGAGKKCVTQPRTLIVAGEDAQATVLERFRNLGAPNDVYFTNAVAEISLARSARVDHVKLLEESTSAYHIANTQVVQAGRSAFSTHYLALGGGLVRNEVRVRFEGEYAEATVNGLYVARGKQHLDNHTVIDHAQPNCVSHELYKGILDDEAHGVFNGKIFVRKDAQKTDAKQTNKVLLLSDKATINTKPQLEIFADDVKCTHGATVGQLDAEQRYYLQSRGIPRAEAERILTFAFANDIVSRLKLDALRAEIEALLVR